MPRRSKTPFTIYSDVTGLHTPDSTCATTFDDAVAGAFPGKHSTRLPDADSPIASIENDLTSDYMTETDDEARSYTYASPRRISELTSASISSIPDSSVQSDDAEDGYAIRYPPSKERPLFRNASSVRRMQLNSPEPSILGGHHGSPRGSSTGRSFRGGTPNSLRVPRAAHIRTSPKPRTRERQEEKDRSTYPLVLLHATLLPVTLPWSVQSMREILPEKLVANVEKLRTKMSDTVLQRGVLISHPRNEFDLLEERLLEALELKKERLTKCGHFVGRESGSEEGEDGGEGEDSDADTLLGSTGDGDEERCATCRRVVKESKRGLGTEEGRWEIKVYAANGLMRAGAWGAAWSDMERVDVEILPWIPDELRKKLDAAQAEELAALQPQGQQRNQQHREQAQNLDVQMLEIEAVEPTAERHAQAMICAPSSLPPPLISQLRALDRPRTRDKITQMPHSTPAADLPQAYRPKEIPLDVLIRNYLYLLAKDRRNIVIAMLAILLLFLSVNSKPQTPLGQLVPNGPVPPTMLEQIPPLEHLEQTIFNNSTPVVAATSVSGSEINLLVQSGEVPDPAVGAPSSTGRASTSTLPEAEDLPCQTPSSFFSPLQQRVSESATAQETIATETPVTEPEAAHQPSGEGGEEQITPRQTSHPVDDDEGNFADMPPASGEPTKQSATSDPVEPAIVLAEPDQLLVGEGEQPVAASTGPDTKGISSPSDSVGAAVAESPGPEQHSSI